MHDPESSTGKDQDSSGHPKTKFPLSTKEIYLPPEIQRAENKRQRQEIENGREGSERGKSVFVQKWDKGLPLDGKETDLSNRKMTVYKGKGGNLVLR